MQNYAPISASDTLADGPAVINQNDQAIMSCSSGTVFPTANLQVGMLCYRTDQKKLYQLTDTTPTWVLLLDLSTGSANASGLMSGGVAFQVATGPGPSWGAAIPRVGSDGGCEIGQYLDFHTVTNDSADNAVRLSAASGALTCTGNFNSTGQKNALGGSASAWNTAYIGLDLGVAGALSAGTNGDVLLCSNSYATATGWASKIAGAASIFKAAVNGTFGWWSVPSVAAGAGQPLNQVMTLDATGNLWTAGSHTCANVSASGSLSAAGPIETNSVVVSGTTGGLGAAATSGYCALNPGDGAHSGYIAFWTNNGTRQGYVGYVTSGGQLVINSDNGSGISLSGGNVSMPSFTVTSDARLKSDIEPLTGAGELIERVNAYEYTKDGRRQWGVIAQELQDLAPLLVRKGAQDMLEVDYTGLFVALLAEVRSHRERLAALEAERR